MFRRKFGDIPLKWTGVGILLLIWLVFGAVPDQTSIPTLPATIQALFGELGDPNYWGAIGDTLQTWFVSLVIGSVIGITLGILAGLNVWMERSIAAPVEFFKTIPIIAVLPLGILVLGTGPSMRMTLVAFAVTWPLLVQTLYGVRSIDPMIRDSARSIGVGPVRTFFSVVLPSASPFIATGVRVAAAMALVITIVIELVAGGSGLGVEISNAELSGVTALPTMYALILTTGVVGMLLTGVIGAVERRLLAWHTTYRSIEVAA